MSEQSKKEVKEIEKTFRRLEGEIGDAAKRAGTLGDKELNTKIQKVKEGSGDIIKYIEKRTGGNS